MKGATPYFLCFKSRCLFIDIGIKMAAKSFWVEIRPLATTKTKPLNLAPILDTLYGLKQPFKMVFINAPSERVPERRVIRIFVGLPSREIGEHFVKILQTLIGVQVVPRAPPVREYPQKVELHMSRHFALPIINFEQPLDYNPVDVLISTLAGVPDSAIEIVGVGDPKARSKIYEYVLRKMRKVKPLSKTVTDTFFGIGAEIAVQRDVKDVSRESFWKYGRYTKVDEWDKTVIKAAATKMKYNQFKCEINIYGNPLTVNALIGAFPAALNKLELFKSHHREKLDLAVEKPKGGGIKATIKNFLFKYAPLIILGIGFVTGLFQPIGEGFKINIRLQEQIFLGLAIVVWIGYLIQKRKKPIVLSTEELAAIASLPTAIGKLPIELGTTPITRRGLVEARFPQPKTEEEQNQ